MGAVFSLNKYTIEIQFFLEGILFHLMNSFTLPYNTQPQKLLMLQLLKTDSTSQIIFSAF